MFTYIMIMAPTGGTNPRSWDEELDAVSTDRKYHTNDTIGTIRHPQPSLSG